MVYILVKILYATKGVSPIEIYAFGVQSCGFGRTQRALRQFAALPLLQANCIFSRYMLRYPLNWRWIPLGCAQCYQSVEIQTRGICLPRRRSRNRGSLAGGICISAELCRKIQNRL